MEKPSLKSTIEMPGVVWVEVETKNGRSLGYFKNTMSDADLKVYLASKKVFTEKSTTLK